MAASSADPKQRISLLPREHGAYVQLGVALGAGLLLGHGNPRAWGQVGLTIVLFLASGPLLALLDLRDPALKSRALRWLALLGGLALLSAALAWWHASLEQWRATLIPLLLAGMLTGLALTKREHTTLGELVAAWALSSAAYPVAILGGAGLREAGLLALALAGIHSIGTATVRSFLESLRRKGHPLPRAVPLLLGLVLAGSGLVSRLPFAWIVALAMVPSTGVAAWMLVSPPPPRHMKRIGWILTLASVAGVLPVIFALR